MLYDPKSYFKNELEIERVACPDPDEFQRKYVETQTPVILTGVVEQWPAFTRWTNDYLREKCGEREIEVSHARKGVHFHGKDKVLELSRIPFGKYVDLVENGELKDGKLYATVVPIPKALPEIADDVTLPPYFEPKRCPKPNLWFGPGNNVVPLHYDAAHNFLAQVRGRKTLLLFPPNEIKKLYPFPFQNTSSHVSQIHIAEPDPEKFPRIKDARCAVVELQPGEMLFLPLFWWHAVFGHDENMSVNFWWRAPVMHYLKYPRFVVRVHASVGLFLARMGVKKLVEKLRQWLPFPTKRFGTPTLAK